MIPYLACMLAVANLTGLPPRLLPVIQTIEGGAIGMIRPDHNGTADLGVMQVNTVWLAALAARAELSLLATRARLIDDPCFNIAAAALILRYDLTQTGGALFRHTSRRMPEGAISTIVSFASGRRLLADGDS